MSTQAPIPVIQNGLVLCLDAANTKSYSGSGTNWTDLSRNGNNGTLTNGPTFSSTNGGSIVFDGTNDYVAFGDVLNLGTNDMTINVWYTLASITTGYTTLVSKAKAAAQNYRYALLLSDGKLLAFLQGDSGADIIPIGGTLPSTNTWGMGTAVFTRNSSIKIYYNARLETLTGSAVISQWNGLNFQSNNPFTVGCYTASDNITSSLFHNGKIGLVEIYFRSLTPSEILQNYNSTKSRFGL